MKESLIIIQPGEYSNSDAYESVLTYISKKDYVGGYGIPLPPSRNALIKSFYRIEQNSNYQNSRYLWHFVISLPTKTDNKKFLQMADNIAIQIAYHYQVVYALDLEKEHSHIHFTINAYSYQPDYPPLSEEIFENYMRTSLCILQNTYPMYQAKLTVREDNLYV